jgi:hypothetical protein
MGFARDARKDPSPAQQSWMLGSSPSMTVGGAMDGGTRAAHGNYRRGGAPMIKADIIPL